MIVGKWWNDRNIDLVKIDGRIYALNEWNGERWLNCWECLGEDNMEVGKTGIEIQPIWEEVEEDTYDIVEYIVVRG